MQLKLENLIRKLIREEVISVESAKNKSIIDKLKQLKSSRIQIDRPDLSDGNDFKNKSKWRITGPQGYPEITIFTIDGKFYVHSLMTHATNTDIDRILNNKKFSKRRSISNYRDWWYYSPYFEGRGKITDVKFTFSEIKTIYNMCVDASAGDIERERSFYSGRGHKSGIGDMP